jgi:EAL domain-containing protein (putative c-di-GMP-specific phosphodiesterase class I)
VQRPSDSDRPTIGVDHSQGYFISEPRPDMNFALQVNPA